MNQLIIYFESKIYSAEFSPDEFKINSDSETDDGAYEDQIQDLFARIKCEPVKNSPHLAQLQKLSRQLAWEEVHQKELLCDENGILLALLQTTQGSCLIRHFSFAGGYYIDPPHNSKYPMIVSSETYEVTTDDQVTLKNVIVADFNHDEDEGMGAEVVGQSELEMILTEMADTLETDSEYYGFHTNVWISDQIEGQLLNTLPEHWLGQSGHKFDHSDLE